MGALRTSLISVFLHGGEGERALESLLFFINTLALSRRASPLWPHLTLIIFLKTLTPSTAALELRASPYELWGTQLSLYHWTFTIPKAWILKSPNLRKRKNKTYQLSQAWLWIRSTRRKFKKNIQISCPTLKSQWIKIFNDFRGY